MGVVSRYFIFYSMLFCFVKFALTLLFFFKCTYSSFQVNLESCHIFWLKEVETGNVGLDRLLLKPTLTTFGAQIYFLNCEILPYFLEKSQFDWLCKFVASLF